jgi:glutathione S-transferase
MRLLYHLPLSPHCRKVRLVLSEKRLEFTLSSERAWDASDEFSALNPAAALPVLVEDDGRPLSESNAIVEYLEEVSPTPSILPGDHSQRAEARRLSAWFDSRFHIDVSGPIIYERVDKRVMRLGEPNMSNIRRALDLMRQHLDFIGYLTERRSWLAGEDLTIADLAAAAHLSCLDYIGDIPWRQHPGAKDWYARIKSRPSFRPLLADHVPGMPPPRHYANLDF